MADIIAGLCYDYAMKIILLLILLLPVVVLASDIYVTEVASPYAIVPVTEDIKNPQLHLGVLDNFPVMYEFYLASSTDFRAKISQPIISGKATPNPFGLMLVRQDDRGGGVTEIARLTSAEDSWSITKDSSIGSSFWQGEEIETTLQSGTYRIEVSTPDNEGKYLLNFGPEGDYGYFASLSRAWTIQQFLGYSPLRILTSSLVYYPLGILFITFLISRTWKYRKMISNVS
jgi:hypothetical protein